MPISLLLSILSAFIPLHTAAPSGVRFGLDEEASAGHRVDVDYDYYFVSGQTAHALLESMRRNGPHGEGERYFGITTWQTSLQYTAEETREGCRLSKIGVTTDVVILLPMWREEAGAPIQLQEAWGEFVRRLAYHEKGHRDMAGRQSRAIYDALEDLKVNSSCSSMDRHARVLVDETAARFEELNREYDRASDHGRSQGVVWPPAEWVDGAPDGPSER